MSTPQQPVITIRKTCLVVLAPIGRSSHVAQVLRGRRPGVRMGAWPLALGAGPRCIARAPARGHPPRARARRGVRRAARGAGRVATGRSAPSIPRPRAADPPSGWAVGRRSGRGAGWSGGRSSCPGAHRRCVPRWRCVPGRTRPRGHPPPHRFRGVGHSATHSPEGLLAARRPHRKLMRHLLARRLPRKPVPWSGRFPHKQEVCSG